MPPLSNRTDLDIAYSILGPQGMIEPARTNSGSVSIGAAAQRVNAAGVIRRQLTALLVVACKAGFAQPPSPAGDHPKLRSI
jgi:hypothetical protein